MNLYLITNKDFRQYATNALDSDEAKIKFIAERPGEEIERIELIPVEILSELPENDEIIFF